jgi:hypothetical protein
MPNVPNTPMLSAAGEFSGGAHVSFRGNASINGAYAVSDHIGLIGGGSYMNDQTNSKDFKHRLIEVGGGYFDTFGPDNNRIIEAYAGFGTGSADRMFREFDRDGNLLQADVEDVSYNKIFFQVNYSSKKKNDFRLFGNNYPINYGTALRMSRIDMDRFIRNSVVQRNESNVFLEPVFFTRMRLSKAFQLQYTSSFNLGLKDRKYLTAGNSIFTIGAIVNIGNNGL